MTKHLSRLVLVAAMSALVSGCALNNPNISELKSNPGRYYDRTVSIDGVVTDSWGTSVLPFRMYRIDDGTGEVTRLTDSPETARPSSWHPSGRFLGYSSNGRIMILPMEGDATRG